MKRRAIIAGLFGVVFFVGCQNQQEVGLTSVPTEIVISEKILNGNLNILAAGMQNEMTVCLRGHIKGDTAYITDVRIPEHEGSTTISLKVKESDRCAANKGDLATWHNHPTGQCIQITALQMGAGSFGKSLCYLSTDDIKKALEGSPTYFQVVHNGPGHWCWWPLEEVKHFADSGHVQGYPAEGHEIGSVEPVKPPFGNPR